jgi:hypothetical protein
MKFNKCTLALLAAALLSLRVEAGPVNLMITGERIPLSVPPQWTNSGAWSKEADLLLVDVLRSEVRRYDAAGRFVGALNGGYAKARGYEDPTLIQNTETGEVWVEYEDGYIVRFDDQLRAKSATGLVGSSGSEGKIISLFWWVPLGDSELLAFGDIQVGSNFTGAVLRVPLGHPGDFKVLREVPSSSPAHRFFLIGQSYLTSTQGNPYYLIMGETPSVFKPNGSSFELVRVTKSGSQPLGRPELPQRINMETTKLLFEHLERTAAPVGLYGRNGFLYILMRTPDEGRTIWTLLKVDPRTNTALWNRVVNTSANYLVVVPGEKYWAFVEKGPVNGPGQQKVYSFLKVPTRIVEGQ